MKKKALAILFILILLAVPVSAGLSDILKGTLNAALELFKREVAPVDGYKCIYVYGSEAGDDVIVLEGAHWYNPDYHIYVENATVEFSWWIPRRVDVKASAWKVYFGLFAIQVKENDDIWWTWWKPYGSKGPGLGAFWVSGFDWKRSGVSEAKKACIAYDLPKSDDILSLDYKNLTILKNGTVKITLNNSTTLYKDFKDVFEFGNLTTGRFEYKHLIGPLYLVREKEGDE